MVVAGDELSLDSLVDREPVVVQATVRTACPTYGVSANLRVAYPRGRLRISVYRLDLHTHLDGFQTSYGKVQSLRTAWLCVFVSGRTAFGKLTSRGESKLQAGQACATGEASSGWALPPDAAIPVPAIARDGRPIV